MKNHIHLTLLAFSSLFLFSCDASKSDASLLCQEIVPGQTFTATPGVTYCEQMSGWKMTLGPLIEDSRCNVNGVACIWEGRFVMGVSFENGDAVQDTFYAAGNWRDTLYHSPFAIMLNEVYPLNRTSFELLDPAEYSFDMMIQ